MKKSMICQYLLYILLVWDSQGFILKKKVSWVKGSYRNEVCGILCTMSEVSTTPFLELLPCSVFPGLLIQQEVFHKQPSVEPIPTVHFPPTHMHIPRFTIVYFPLEFQWFIDYTSSDFIISWRYSCKYEVADFRVASNGMTAFGNFHENYIRTQSILEFLTIYNFCEYMLLSSYI